MLRLVVGLFLFTVPASDGFAQWFGFGGTPGGQQVSGAAVAKAIRAGGTESKAARVRWLDKQTNRVQTVALQAGTTQALNGMNVSMTRCLADYGGEVLQDIAWLEVREEGRSTPWFAGWMFNTFPEVATFDHPRYDLQLLGCGEAPRRKPATANAPAVKEQQAAPQGVDSEAPPSEGAGTDSEAPPAGGTGGEDPYYVPGVERQGNQMPPPAGAENAAPAARQEAVPAAMVAPAPPEERNELHRMMDLPQGQ